MGGGRSINSAFRKKSDIKGGATRGNDRRPADLRSGRKRKGGGFDEILRMGKN